ncbi:hypothetical protein [Streptomyces lavendulae]|uniref:hypothetical protein n=1 Tax=Streptomyces lavendulae TaxID=1914 RepID=UPI0024A35E28|nr:hypothetical protein [Streptomyces lavendulae]GLV98908.1 hypothetical protein Slala05_25400 [Streptomyces lavendulae subsp. lavendulae]
MSDPLQQPASPPPVPPAAVPPAPAGPSRAKLWAAGAAVVSAIAGVASAIAAFSNNSPSPAAVPPPTAVTLPAPQAASTPGAGAGAGAGSSAGTGTGTGAGAAPASVRWSGKIVLGLEGVDLTQNPPRRGDGSTFGYRPAAARSGSSSMTVKGTAALWTDASAPTPQGCRDLLATQSRSEVVVAEGDSVCLVNEKSPIAVLKVTATHYDDGTYGLIEGELTTWNLRGTG